MSTLETVLLSLLVIDAVALIVLILIQQGKGADVGAAFGSGSSNTVLGSSGGGNLMTKITTWLAIAFFMIAFGLAYTAKERAAQANTLGIPQAVEDSDAVPLAGPNEEMPSGDIPGF
jgi:preprotein translocase subunit SecG